MISVQKYICCFFILTHFLAKSQWKALPDPPSPTFTQDENCRGTLTVPHSIMMPVSENEIVYNCLCTYGKSGHTYVMKSTDDFKSAQVLFLQGSTYGASLLTHMYSENSSTFSYLIYIDTHLEHYYTENSFATRTMLLNGLQNGIAVALSPNYMYVNAGDIIGHALKNSQLLTYFHFPEYKGAQNKLNLINDSVGFTIVTHTANESKTSFMRLTDFGKNLTPLFTDSVDLITDYHFSDNGNLYLLKRSGAVYVSNDTGSSFKTLTSAPQGTYSCIRFSDSLTGFLGGDKGTLLKTINGGASWEQEKSNTDEDITSIYTFKKTNYFVVKSKRVFKYYYYQAPPPFMPLSVFPNPFENTFTISFDLISFNPGAYSEIPLEIYNMNGVKVVEMNLISNSTKIDFSQFPAGVYYLKATNNESVFTAKLIKL